MLRHRLLPALRAVPLLCCWLIATPFVHAEDRIEIVGDENERPRIYWEDNQAKGILVNLLRYVEQHSDLRFHIDLKPWARAYSEAVHGEAGIIGLSKNAAREKIFDYSKPVYFEDLLLVSLQTSPIVFQNIQDLYGKRIGVVHGGFYGDDFETARVQNHLTVFEDNSPDQRLRLLLGGRTDAAIIGSGHTGFTATLKLDPNLKAAEQRFYVANKPVLRDPNYIGFNKSMHRADTLQQINQILAAGYETGELQQLIAQAELASLQTHAVKSQ